MKNSLLLLVFLACTLTTQAQTFTNEGFETWSTYNALLSLERPGNWYGTDQLTYENILVLAAMGATPQKQLAKSTSAHNGTYAAQLKTVNLGDSLGNVPCVMVNAKMTLNLTTLLLNPSLDDLTGVMTFSGGTPVLGSKVDTVSAWVKLTSDNLDSASVTISALQKVTLASGTDTLIPIGAGAAIIPNNVSDEYWQLSVPVIYATASNTATDTLIVGFVSSAVTGGGSTGHEGNTLYVDDVTMVTSSGSSLSVRQPLTAGQSMLVYPNPAGKNVYFNLHTALNPKDYTLSIFDINGKLISSQKMTNHINHEDVGAWPKGIYLYQLSSDGGQTASRGKFVVE
ncbi:MAG: T9SS type A sorting domain-containing protein [Edaphocola sp.]